MWELDHKEGWAWKNWHFWTVILEKTLESPLDCKEIKPVNLKRNQPEYSLEGPMLKLKPIIWPPDVKNWLIGKDTDAEKRLKAGGKGENRKWNGWMASPTQWTWVWASSRSWWWTGRPGVLQSMGSQRVGHDWATELNNKHVIKAVKAYEQPSELSTETDCEGSIICPRQLWQSPAAMRRALGPFLFRLKKEHL